jgi:calcium-dependent protein kinase
MDLCTGGHLGDLLSYGGKSILDESRAKILVTQLVSAVAHLHSRGICHRDIKLQNILMEHRDYVTAQIKLIDFGFATHYVGLCPLKTRCGTPYTTAPEVYRESYDERCDLWSVGVVTYILLSGYRPFVAVDLPGDLKNAGKAAMVTSILMGRYHFDHASFKKVSSQGISFIENMLRPDYTRRWHAVDALNSPWLSNNSRSSAKFNLSSGHDTALSAAVSNIRRKASASSLGTMSMVAVAFSRSQNDATHLRSLFQSFDAENCGFLTKSSFRCAMLSASPDLTAVEADLLFEAIDVDNDQQISFTEFLASTMDPREVKVEDLSKAFHLLDSDHKGYLTQDDFYRVLAVPSNGNSRRMKLLRRSISAKSLRPSSSHGSGCGSDDLSKSYATGMGQDDQEMHGPEDEAHLNKLMTRIRKMIDSADSDKDGVISYSEFLAAMDTESAAPESSDLVMSDVADEGFKSNISIKSVKSVTSVLKQSQSVAVLKRENSGKILEPSATPVSANVSPPRPKLNPAALKRGRSMPFIDADDQTPLSPIHESPHRGTGQKFFFGANGEKGSISRTPSVSPKNNSPMQSLFSSPRATVHPHCTYELSRGPPSVDEHSLEDLSLQPFVDEQEARRKHRKSPVPMLMTSTSNKTPAAESYMDGGYFRKDRHQEAGDVADGVYEFDPPPFLKNAKKWASEGNMLRDKAHFSAADLLEDDDASPSKVVNGSPDVVRAQKKIEYIVEAVNEIGTSHIMQTPRLALSRHNSRIDPKMLEPSPRVSSSRPTSSIVNQQSDPISARGVARASLEQSLSLGLSSDTDEELFKTAANGRTP